MPHGHILAFLFNGLILSSNLIHVMIDFLNTFFLIHEECQGYIFGGKFTVER